MHTRILIAVALTLLATNAPAQEPAALPDGAAVQLGVHRLRIPTAIRGFALTPDGKRLVVSFDHPNEKNNVLLYDTATGLPRKPLAIAGAFLMGMAREKPLMVVITNKGGEFWDIAKEQRIRQWTNPERTHTTTNPAVSPDGTMAIVAGIESDKGRPVILRRNLTTGELLPAIYPGGNEINSVHISADGGTFFTVSSTVTMSDGKKQTVLPGSLIVWDAKTGKKLLERRNDDRTPAIAPNGSRYARAVEKSLEIIELEEPFKTVTLPITGSRFAFTPDGKQLVVGANSGQPLRVWDVAENKEVRTLEGLSHGYHHVPQFSRDGRLVAVIQDDSWDYYRYRARGGFVQLWDMTTGKKIRYETGHPSTVNGIAYSPDGKRLATCSDDTLLLYDPATGKELYRWIGHKSTVMHIAYSPDGKLLASGSADGTIALWDPATAKERKRLQAKESIKSLAFTRDGASLISVTANHAVQTWDIEKGVLVRTLKEQFGFASPVLAPTAQYATSFGNGRPFAEPDGNVKWLNVRSGKMATPFDPAPNRAVDEVQRRFEYTIPWDLAFSPDARLFATCDSLQTQGLRAQIADHTVRVWESATRREILRVTGNPAYTHVLAFSPDNRILAHGVGPGGAWGHGAGNAALILRDITTAQHVSLATTYKDSKPTHEPLKDYRQITGHLGSITSLTFSPDGKFLATGGSDSVVYIWPVKDFFKPAELAVEKNDAASYWPHLAEPDPGKAYRAIAQLEQRPKETLALLRKHLSAVPRADEKAIGQHLRDLASSSFGVRQQASAALEKAGEQAAHLLHEAAKSPPNLEVKRRLEALLERLDDPYGDGNQLRIYRSLVLLERIGTPDARKLLEELSHGAPAAWLSVEAAHSVRRTP